MSIVQPVDSSLTCDFSFASVRGSPLSNIDTIWLVLLECKRCSGWSKATELVPPLQRQERKTFISPPFHCWGVSGGAWVSREIAHTSCFPCNCRSGQSTASPDFSSTRRLTHMKEAKGVQFGAKYWALFCHLIKKTSGFQAKPCLRKSTGRKSKRYKTEQIQLLKI